VSRIAQFLWNRIKRRKLNPFIMPNDQTYQEYLVQRLFTVAMEAALPMAITPDCREHLIKIVADGLQNRWDSSGAPPPELRLVIAEGNIRRLVAQMKVEARDLGRNDLGENTFFGALRKLCPFWPIC
jgi:hypothetical protein